MIDDSLRYGIENYPVFKGLWVFYCKIDFARLPILQGGTASLLVPTLAIMTQKTWACPYTKARKECK